MTITPEDYKVGSRFIFVLTGDIWTLKGFSGVKGIILSSCYNPSMENCFSRNQPNMVPLPENVTDDQIVALVNIVTSRGSLGEFDTN